MWFISCKANIIEAFILPSQCLDDLSMHFTITLHSPFVFLFLMNGYFEEMFDTVYPK